MNPIALLTPAHLLALGNFASALPVDDIADLLDGTATVDTTLDLAEKAAKLVAMAFPPAAIAAGDADLALEALRFLLDAIGAASNPVTGGMPPNWHPGPGVYAPSAEG